jgi:chorismate mutase
LDTPLNITPISSWFEGLSLPLIIAGPCSAESEEQVMDAALQLAGIERVKVFRAGIWKPRTRPGSFEGAGEKGLRWLQRVQRETGLLVTTEVATPAHVQMALDYGIDIVWIGARTTASPFTTEQLAVALSHSNIPVLVKNPITPDLELWIGALERFNRMGITKLAAVHRGFYPYEHSRLRNIPKWELAIDLKSRFPDLPILCDPSHIAGRADMVAQVAQHGLNLSLDGLMVEVHPNPSAALSDARQQVSPHFFSQLLQKLIFRDSSSACSEYVDFIEQTRNKIDSIDQQIIELLANRMKLVEQIGEYKRDNNVTVFQLRRWERILESRVEYGERLGLSEEYIKNLLRMVHKESIRRQAEILGSKSQPYSNE